MPKAVAETHDPVLIAISRREVVQIFLGFPSVMAPFQTVIAVLRGGDPG